MEEEYIQLIEEATGKKLGDYGFITGTCSPFPAGERGMMSASMQSGWSIWKKNADGTQSMQGMPCGNIKDNLEGIIKFLNNGKTEEGQNAASAD